MNIKELFTFYKPKNEQEEIDRQLILNFLEKNDDALFRTNLACHITSSAFVLNQSMDKIVFAYHHIYQSWAWVGGHADGNPDLLEVAIKEAKEETGLRSIVPYNEDIFILDVIYVNHHMKHGKYVPDHLHLNVTYLMIADESEKLKHNPLEHQDIRWFNLNEVLDYVSEERMKSIYTKAFLLIEKMKESF